MSHRRPLDEEIILRLFSFIEQGMYNGYPICCIDEFLDYFLQVSGYLSDFTQRHVRVLNGTGFIACYRCHQTKNADQLIAEIQSKRVNSLVFPQEHPQAMGGEEFQKLSRSTELLFNYCKTEGKYKPDVVTWVQKLYLKKEFQ